MHTENLSYFLSLSEPEISELHVQPPPRNLLLYLAQNVGTYEKLRNAQILDLHVTSILRFGRK